MFYFTKKPWILKQIYGDCIWHIDNSDKIIYLTFDDGPHQTETGFILDQLNQFNAKGTFFCLGENIEKCPEVFNRVKEEGHAVGNHTYSHYDGWRTANEKYFDDIEKADKIINAHLFRPPYGHITRFEVKRLKKEYNFKTVMWSVMSGDFDKQTSGEECLKNVIHNTKEGSIVVFHDNDAASANLRYALPRVLEHFSKKDFKFEKITLS